LKPATSGRPRPDVIDSPGFRSVGGGFVPLPKSKSAVSTIAGKLMSSARALHDGIVDGRESEQLKHPETFLP